MPVNPNDSHHCYIHDESGNSAAWYWKHVEEKPHDYRGHITTCNSCNKPECISDYVGCLFNRALPPAFCDDCKKMLGMKK